MSWRTNPIVVHARNLGRSLGVNRLLAGMLNARGYEANFDASFSSRLRPGDCVWDVGANVGYYAVQFAQKVGASGRVFAFEPNPATFPKLVQACSAFANVVPLPLGLGREAGRAAFEHGRDDLAATSRIVDHAASDLMVEVRPAAELIAQGQADAPNAIKIDVEGFELEVLQGLGDRIADPALRAVGVEMHFGILNRRGLAGAPATIEAMLRGAGFRLAWPDASHLIATRIVQ